MTKQELREKYLKIRDNIPADIRREKSKKIINQITTSKEYLNAQSLMTYINIKSEVETSALAEKVLDDGKTLLVPKCNTTNKTISVHIVKDLSQLEIAAFGILEPNNTTKVLKNTTDIDIIIIPALLFDKNGHRIGYGAGYYDRFLASSNGLKIGICYRECLLDHIETEEHDIPADLVINA